MSFRSIQNTDATFRNLTITGKLSVPGETSYPTEVKLDKITSVDGTNEIDLTVPNEIYFNTSNSYFDGNVVLTTGNLDMQLNKIENVSSISGYNGLVEIASGNQLYLQGYGNLNNCKDQGAYIDWNDGSGDGKMNLICNRGGGHGGFSFYNVHKQSDGTVDPATTGEVVDINGSGDMKLYSVTDSTSATTGALVVDGGIGCVKNMTVGQNLHVVGTTVFDNTVTLNQSLNVGQIYGHNSLLTVASGNILLVEGNGSLDKCTTQGSYIDWNHTNGQGKMNFICNRGGGSGGFSFYNLHNLSDGTVDPNTTNELVDISPYGNLLLYSTTDSTSSSTGALMVDGGATIAKQLRVAGVTTVTNATDSTSSATGALIVDGGASVVKQLRVGGVTTLSDTVPSTSNTTGTLVVGGGMGVAQDLHIGGTLYAGGNVVAGNLPDQEFHCCQVTGHDGNALGTQPLNANRGNTNYAVFSSIYDNLPQGSGGTYNANDTSSAFKNVIISNITNTSFDWIVQKNTGDNVNATIIFWVVFSGALAYQKTQI